jgi:hypothetical protein
VSFLRRVFGGGADKLRGSPSDAGPDAADATRADNELHEAQAEEAERDRALLREDAERLSDTLLARQLRYADRRWTPPAQGGVRRADDPDAGDERR